MATRHDDADDGTAFDHIAGYGSEPSPTAMNLAQRLQSREEVTRVSWLSNSRAVKVRTRDADATIRSFDHDRVAVTVSDTSPIHTRLRVTW